MDGNRTTKLLNSIIDNIEELHSIWTEETDKETRDKIYSALQSLEEAEDKLKKAYIDRVIDNLK